MGSHSMQAIALSVFLFAAIVFCAGLAMAGNVPTLIAGLAAFAVSVWLFLRCKQLEEGTRG